LNESEEALIEAFTLRAIRPERITSSTGFDTDRFHIMIQESCDRDKEEIEREKSNILKRIQNQKRIVTMIEAAIFTLPEPMREISILRYINQLRWNDVQKKTGRSPAGIYKIHSKALEKLELKLCCSRNENRQHVVSQSPI
jgi:DNA-directed RNA polymerase specialized sigma subunit